MRKAIRIGCWVIFILFCLSSYLGANIPWWIYLASAAIPIFLPNYLIKLYDKQKEDEALEEYYRNHPEERR